MFPARFACAAQPADTIEIQPSPGMRAARIEVLLANGDSHACYVAARDLPALIEALQATGLVLAGIVHTHPCTQEA